jgi:hypothetical protein
MNSKLPFYSFLLVTFISINSFAQNYTITGKVFDAESKEPLPFVPVLIKGTTVGATTDFDGNYSITTSKLADSIVSSYVSYKNWCDQLNVEKPK